jgi:two-component system, response regulator
MSEPFEILLVEDYVPDAELVIRMFKRNRITNKIHVVSDGNEALDFVFCRGAWRSRKIGQPPLVALVDIRLPKIDGWEILRQIKQNPQTNGIPVIMVSGSLFEAEAERARGLGADGSLSKPVRMSELKAALKECDVEWSIADVANMEK